MKLISLNKKWKRRDITLLLERLELYVSSGLTINKALEIAGEGISPKQKSSLESVRLAVESGGLLSQALTKNIGLSPTISSLIEHGELSGNLSSSLSASRSTMERGEELRKKCTSAMVYPVVIGLFATLLTVGLVRGVMPQIIPMLKGLNVNLPFLTRVVISISEGFLNYGIFGGGGFIVVSVVCITAFKKSQTFKKFCHVLISRVPIIGSLIYSYSLSMFLHSFGALVESGISSSRAYSDTIRTISLIPLRMRLQSTESDAKRGIPFGNILSFNKIPSYVAPLLRAGESSGTLGISIIRAASIIDRDIEHSLKRLTSLIEPVMMAGMGLIVGAIALSIMMPIYDISRALQK